MCSTDVSLWVVATIANVKIWRWWIGFLELNYIIHSLLNILKNLIVFEAGYLAFIEINMMT